MLKRHKKALAGVAMAALLAAGTGIGTALAREQTPRAQDKVALGGPRVKHLLLLMDQDQNGKVSKQEFMHFMQAEFDRLDKDQSGQLDVKELTHSKVPPAPLTIAGK
jgi:hypothetical protein